MVVGWFGIRKDFSQFLLSICPVLQEYANIAYTSGRTGDTERERERERDTTPDIGPPDSTSSKDKSKKLSEINKPVVPIVPIDMPD